MTINFLNNNIGEVVGLTSDKFPSQLKETTTMITKTSELVFRNTNNLYTLSEKQFITEILWFKNAKNFSVIRHLNVIN